MVRKHPSRLPMCLLTPFSACVALSQEENVNLFRENAKVKADADKCRVELEALKSKVAVSSQPLKTKAPDSAVRNGVADKDKRLSSRHLTSGLTRMILGNGRKGGALSCTPLLRPTTNVRWVTGCFITPRGI